MKSDGAEGDFPYHQRHGNDIHAAIANKRANKLSAPIVGYRTAELGAARRRPDRQGPRHDGGHDLRPRRKTMKYESHVDVVVEVGDGVLYAVGGNVGQTVPVRRWRSTRRAAFETPTPTTGSSYRGNL